MDPNIEKRFDIVKRETYTKVIITRMKKPLHSLSMATAKKTIMIMDNRLMWK